MGKLEVYQRYADKVATKLGLTVKPVLRWKCAEGNKLLRYAHTHMNKELPGYGTICLSPRKGVDYRGWRWLIAHEVCHLKVVNHNSLAFKTWMGKMGFNQSGERQTALVAGRIAHRHLWGVGMSQGRREGSSLALLIVSQRCARCNATRLAEYTLKRVWKED